MLEKLIYITDIAKTIKSNRLTLLRHCKKHNIKLLQIGRKYAIKEVDLAKLSKSFEVDTNNSNNDKEV